MKYLTCILSAVVFAQVGVSSVLGPLMTLRACSAYGAATLPTKKKCGATSKNQGNSEGKETMNALAANTIVPSLTTPKL